MSKPDYDEMDPPVVALCRTINERLTGLQTLGSCGGHAESESTGASAAENEWYVTLTVELAEDERPTFDGWLSLEFLAWALRDFRRAGHALEATFFALPPFLNDPGKMLTFEISGRRDGPGGIEAASVAEKLDGMISELFVAEDEE